MTKRNIMCENKVITKCFELKIWQKRWTFSRKAFGIEYSSRRKESEEILVEKESAKNPVWFSPRKLQTSNPILTMRGMEFYLQCHQNLKIQRFM